MRDVFRFKHIHGIDLAEERQLVAHERSHEEIRKRIGCDTLVYLPLDRLVEACLLSGSETPVTSFEVGLFSGSYVTVPGVLSVNERLDMPVEVRQSW
jgi:amidophosphoribosyltransferase